MYDAQRNSAPEPALAAYCVTRWCRVVPALPPGASGHVVTVRGDLCNQISKKAFDLSGEFSARPLSACVHSHLWVVNTERLDAGVQKTRDSDGMWLHVAPEPRGWAEVHMHPSPGALPASQSRDFYFKTPLVRRGPGHQN